MSFHGVGTGDREAHILAQIPGFPGRGLGEITLTTHLMGGHGRKLPMLMSCSSMRSSYFVLDCIIGCVYIQMTHSTWRRRAQFLKVPLVWTGYHYPLPIDLAGEESAQQVFLTLEDADETEVQIDYDYSKVVSAKGWERLENLLRSALGRTIKIKRSQGVRMVRTGAFLTENASSSDAPRYSDP